MATQTQIDAFHAALERARILSLRSDYRDCAVYVCAALNRVDGIPSIVGYTCGDWYDSAVVATFVNGHERI